MDPIVSKLQGAALEKINPNSGGSNGGTGTSSFQKTFENVQSDSTNRLLEMVEKMTGKEEGMNAVDASSIQVELYGKEESEKAKKSGRTDFASQRNEAEKVPGVGHIFSLLQDINQSQNQFENMMSMVSSGKNFSVQQMFVMQTAAHQITFQTELLSRVGESATKIPNQIMNMQIG